MTAPDPITAYGQAHAVRVDGAELSVRETGSPEGPPVMLLHGLIGTRDHVLMRSTRLEREGYRVIACDARGHGRSSASTSPGGYGYGVLESDVLAVMDRLAVESAVIAGVSMGCHTALRLAISHPDRVAAIAAVTPAFDPRDHPTQERVARSDRLATALREGGPDAFAEALHVAPAWGRRAGTYRSAMRQRLTRHDDLSAVADALEQVMRGSPFEALEDLGGIDVPVVVVASRDDYDIDHPLATGQAYADALPRATLVSEQSGELPLAWNGTRLARVVAELAGAIHGAQSELTTEVLT